jgi:hypothetical protein
VGSRRSRNSGCWPGLRVDEGGRGWTQPRRLNPEWATTGRRTSASLAGNQGRHARCQRAQHLEPVSQRQTSNPEAPSCRFKSRPIRKCRTSAKSRSYCFEKLYQAQRPRPLSTLGPFRAPSAQMPNPVTDDSEEVPTRSDDDIRVEDMRRRSEEIRVQRLIDDLGYWRGLRKRTHKEPGK